MKPDIIRLKHPFGEVCFEDELLILKEHYKEYFFNHLPFNEASLDDDTYLIVGRRGVGKSSLAHYFTFQEHLKNARCIDVDEPRVYQDVLPGVANMAADSNAVAIPQIVKMWESVLWLLILNEYKETNPIVSEACLFRREKDSVSSFVRKLIKHFASVLLKNKEGNLADAAEKILESESMQKAKAAVLPILKDCPVLIAIDTLEHYDVDNAPMMRATAALIECASKMNTEYSMKGIHVKLFIMAEVFPYLLESDISNVLKFVKREIYMHWRPRDLIRLLCWRFHKYLSERGIGLEANTSVSWENFDDVYRKIWKPFFGETITNRNGHLERSFAYLLRHTQNRPRQLIELCNSIARAARFDQSPLRFDPNMIVETVKECETRLAAEIINSYSEVYKRCGQVVDALMNFPASFKGSRLDQFAPSTASNWPSGQYSPYRFRQLVSELGIVGRVRRQDSASGVIVADFEYFMKGRLPISSSDDCVIHPMFYRRFNIKVDPAYRVYPFPDHQDYKDIYERL